MKIQRIICRVILACFLNTFVFQDYHHLFATTADNPGCGGGGSGGEPVEFATGSNVMTLSEFLIQGRGLPLEFALTYNSASSGGQLAKKWSHTYDISADLAIGLPDKPALTYDKNGNPIFDEVVILVSVRTGIKTTVFKYTRPYVWAPLTQTPSLSEILNLIQADTPIESVRTTSIIPSDASLEVSILRRTLNDHSTLIKNSDGTFTFRKKDGEKYHFSAFSGNFNPKVLSPSNSRWRNTAVSRIASIEDRNSNTLSFSYDGQGRLSS
ncbi:MAG: DUF6531 domain-containing protein, partial [Endomicrobiia bacterium]|nr:DUF6531 domain-containing protein [Endomicrobiia bacterium]